MKLRYSPLAELFAHPLFCDVKCVRNCNSVGITRMLHNASPILLHASQLVIITPVFTEIFFSACLKSLDNMGITSCIIRRAPFPNAAVWGLQCASTDHDRICAVTSGRALDHVLISGPAEKGVCPCQPFTRQSCSGPLGAHGAALRHDDSLQLRLQARRVPIRCKNHPCRTHSATRCSDLPATFINSAHCQCGRLSLQIQTLLER